MSKTITSKVHAARVTVSSLVERLASIVGDGVDIANRLNDLAPSIDGADLSSPTEVVLERMSRGFGLSHFERDLIMVAGLPEEHEVISFALRRLHPTGEPYVSFGLAGELLDLEYSARTHLRRALGAGPLHTHALVTVAGLAPLPEQSLHLMPSLWSVMRSANQWPPGLEPIPLAAQDQPELDAVRLAFAVGQQQSLIVVTGHRTRAARELAAIATGSLRNIGSETAIFTADQISASNAAAVSAHCVARDLVPVIIDGETNPPLQRHPGPVVLCTAEPKGLGLDDRPTATFDLGDRTIAENVTMWSGLVPELNGGVARLAALLQIDGHRAARAAADARMTRAEDFDLDLSSVLTEVRRRTGGELPASVVLARPNAGWDRLVTTERNGDLLRSVIDRVEHQTQVLHDWGFGEARNTWGVRALFAGPPGTGKTLAAEVIAGSLGLDLLVVDLSALVSKWLGETEKNISEVFDAAERTNCVLFFDEADAIFAKRTDAGDAQGRWANLETAHLLTRMERSRGLVVLATNLRGNIDDAFVRRLDVIVEFDEPGPAERAELWRTHLPTQAPLADDIDIDQLAGLYDITGGVIRNASMDAAFRAAADATSINQQRLILSIEREFRKAGRSFPGIPRSLAAARPGGNQHG